MLGNCSYANAEIQRVFLTEWDADVYATFTSGTTQGGLISAYYELPQIWQEVVLNTAIAKYNQALNPKGPNGLTFTETFQIVMPHADADKWAELVSLLTERYIIVFQDANGNWYTLGWRFGTKVRGYVLQDNEYTLNFTNDFTTKLLTSISEDYVQANIL